MATNNSNEQIRNISIQDRQAQNTAADWARQLRFSSDVNKSTVGVDTDRVTPDLLMAASKKLLGISRGQQQGDAKDSLRYQKVYGPVEYFAQHVQRDGGSVARSLLWKATNRGNLDFIGSGSLQPHVSSVFNESNLTRFVDNSTPLDGVDNSMLLTRLGQGGLNSQDSAPIQMRLVQPSYYGYVGGIRTAQKCYSADTLIFTKQGWKNIAQLTMRDQLACLIDNRVEWHTPLLLQSYDHDGMMYGFQNWFIDFLVTPNHRMYVSKDSDVQSFQIKSIDQVYGTKCRVVCGTGKESVVDETQKYFYLPRANSNNMKLTKYIQKVDIVDFAAFMGWYLSQGCCEKRRNWPADKGWKYKVKISQSPKDHPENYQQIRQLIQRLDFGAHPKIACQKKTGLDLVINRKQLFEYCTQFGKSEDKFIPDWIFTAPTKARWAFVDAMVKGDGDQQRHLNTISQKLANGFARLLFQLGQSVNITKELQRWTYKRRIVNPETNFIYTVVWHKQMQQQLRNAPGNKKASGRCFYTEYYKGKVYCPTVPGGLVYVRRPQASKGFWCGNSPGITAYLDKNVMKGTDGRLYQKFYNPRTGKEQLVDSQKAAASVVTTNQYMNSKDKYVYALGGDKGVRIVPRESVDYILPRADQAESMAGNAVPMMSGVKAMRLLMGCLHPQTPVPFIDEQGFTDLVPAKRLGSYGDTYLYGCDQKGYEKLYKLQGVYSRFPDFNRSFKRIITASGRVLVTSPDHKWYVYQGGKYKKITADKLQQGMLIPRSTFFKLPSRLTTIFGITITKEICVLVGRLLKSYEETPKTRRFTYVINQTVNQQSDIIQALKQLNIIGSNFYQRDGIHYVSISDVRLIDWIETEMKSRQAQRKIPKAILSLPKGMTSYVLDSYCKQRENVGEDIFGDIWLLDIPSPIMRDGLSLMLGKIYTDTYYRDSYKNGKQYRALKLIESENQGTVYLQPIKKILDQPAPAFMVDLDCGDNVYAVGNGIITHNSKYALQAVPLQNPQAPLVRSLDQASGKDMDTLIGKFVGAQFSPKSGIVQAVRKDRIDMLYDDGTKGSVGLYDNFPANAKGWLSNYPMVKAGQRVGRGQLLAKSNYTDDKGVAAMGRNLRIGYMSYHGGTFEDACTISQSAAKKMAYTTMYKTGMDTDKSIRSSKTLYNAWKPGEYTKQQMQKLDDKGVVKVGQTLNQGDPVILGIRTTQPSPGTMGKRLLTDVSQTWQHAHPGVVTDVVKTRDGIKVYAKVSAPLALGDKISQRYGGKGTIAQIIPDDKMPRDSKGRPLDILFDPLGIVSRCYDQDTQFLTKQGWKKGSEIDKIQELLTYFPQSDTCRFTTQEDYMYSTNYTGTMYKVTNKDVSFCVTKNHTVFCKTDKQFKTVPVQDVYKEHIWLPTGQDWVQIKPQDWLDIHVSEQKVYCPTVSTGFVATRRDGKIVVLGNTNPSQMMQVGLGKVAQKLGHPIVVPQFMPKGQSRLKWVKDQMKKNNIPWKQDVYDPQTGKTISNVFTGNIYFLPLKHIADTKMSRRGTDQYSAQGIPGGSGQTGCFPAMQNIMTQGGLKSIEQICITKYSGDVLTYNKDTGSWCYSRVIDWFSYKAKKSAILQLLTDKGVIYPTKNHKMYKADGTSCLAQQLKVGDMLRSFTGAVSVKQIKTHTNQTEVNVYDFTVKDTHNYCLTGGINVSNSKRLGAMELGGLVGHNAFNFIQDAKLIRGQSNAQFWRSLRTGEVPVLPGQPLVHKKFFAHLQGSGMHIRKTPKGISIMALTNKDVDQLAGNRELKSKDTYQQKTFREIDGGLFGKDIFGTEGNKWGYIQLDEPLPNPVMQEPLAKLLRMSDQQFQNVVSGKQEVNGLKNSSDIQKALSKIDLKAQRVNALKQLKEASASKRDAALKRYVAIARMQDNGTKPSDYMLDKIPVLPPEFRPITTQGNLTMVADSNYLYAQLLDARDDQREARNLTPELQNEARGNIYKRWKQLVGLYDPQSKKLKSKSVKGLLRWALGTSPKFSAFNRKVLGATVDTVGRAVGSPDPRLKLNQVGVPQQMAWGIFAPFITRSLVQQGYTPVDAMKLVKQKDKKARTVLLDQMSKRPVVVNRAPSLHKYNLYGAWPKLVTGHAMRWSPSICDNMSLDADGDQLNIHVPVGKKGIQDVINKMMPERMAILARKGKIAFMPQKAFMQGLYVATRMGDSSKGVKTFHSIQQAKQAYKNNQIDIDTPIIIKK